jgi:hypothetical protein
MAALAFYLRDHLQYGESRLSFGQPIQAPQPAPTPDFALLWTGEDPAQYGFSAGQQVWSNEFVTLYKHNTGGSTGSNAR